MIAGPELALYTSLTWEVYMTKYAIAILALTIVGTQPALAQNPDAKSKTKTEHKVKTEQKVDKHGNVITTTKIEHKSKDKNGNVVTTTKAKTGSPSFCRSGAGHPVHGRGWCVEKGFGLGTQTWTRSVWQDAVFQNRRSPTVTDVLSSVVLGRLNNYATQTLGLRTPLVGSWVSTSPTREVYLVKSGTTPVAEFVDTNGDGRADYVLMYKR
jgi:hypothetical protein